MRLPFMPLQSLRRRKVQHEQVASLIEQIEGLEHALESSRVCGETPAAYGPAQRLRGSILEEELARKRGELEGLRARLPGAKVRRTHQESVPDGGSEGPIGVASSPISSREPGRLRARIVLSSLAAVAVLLSVAKIPMEHPAGVQAYETAAVPAGSEAALPAAWRNDSAPSTAPTPQVLFTAPTSRKPVDALPPASRVSPPAIDYWEGWVAAAPANKTPVVSAEEPATDEGADETATLDAPGEVVSEAAPERAPQRNWVVTLADVRLRERPATTARTLRLVASGSRLAVVGGSPSGWTHVETNDGAVGWIISSALRPV